MSAKPNEYTGTLPGDLQEVVKGVPSEITERTQEMDVLIGRAFSTYAGGKVLTWLRETYMDNAVEGYVVDKNGTINAEATTFQMYQREGQRILIKNIEMRMKRSKSKN